MVGGGQGRQSESERAIRKNNRDREISMPHISHRLQPNASSARATECTRAEEAPKDQSLPLSHKGRQLHTSPQASTQLASWS